MQLKQGSDPQALLTSSGRLADFKNELSGIESAVNGAIAKLKGAWGGGDLDKLISRYRSECAPAITAFASTVDSMSKSVRANAEAQLKASGLSVPTDDGGPTGTGTETGTQTGPGGAKTGAKGDEQWPHKHQKGESHTVKPKYDAKEQVGNTEYEKGKIWPGGETTKTTTTKDVWEDGKWKEVTTETETTKYDKLPGDKGWTEKSTKTETETEWGEKKKWLPTDDSEAKEKWAKDHPNAAKAKEIGLGAWGSVTDTRTSDIAAWGDQDGNGTMYTTAKAQSEFGIKEGALMAGASVAGGAYAARAEGSHAFADGKGNVSGSAMVGAEGKAEGSVSLGKDGLKAEVGANATVGAKAEGNVSYNNGPLEAHGKAEVLAGAEGSAKASASIGLDGVKTSAGVEGFAGVKAGVEGGGSIAGIGATGGAEVYAGIGGHAKVDANFSADSVKVNVDVGAAIGVGAGVKFSVDVNPTKFLNDVGATQAANAVGDVMQGGANVVAGGVKEVASWFKW